MNMSGNIYVYEGSAAHSYMQSSSPRNYKLMPEINDVFSVKQNDGSVTVVVEASNADSASVIAIGTDGGRLTSVSEVEIYDEYGETTLNGYADTVKVFFWTSFGSMIPLCPAQTIAIN